MALQPFCITAARRSQPAGLHLARPSLEPLAFLCLLCNSAIRLSPLREALGDVPDLELRSLLTT